MTDVPFERVGEGTASEQRYGFSRAVVAGSVIHVSGTTAGSGGTMPEDAYGQARLVLERLVGVIERAGGSAASVFRVRAYVLDSADIDEVLRAQREVLPGNQPAVTAVQVAGLARQGARVEIELEALRTA